MRHNPVLAGVFFAVLNNDSALYSYSPGHTQVCPFLFSGRKKFKHLNPSDFGDIGSTLVVVMVEKRAF